MLLTERAVVPRKFAVGAASVERHPADTAAVVVSDPAPRGNRCPAVTGATKLSLWESNTSNSKSVLRDRAANAPKCMCVCVCVCV